MFPTNQAIKQTARSSLSPVWPQAVSIVFVVFLITALPQLIYQGAALVLNQPIDGEFYVVYNLLSFVFSMFITYPLYLGILHWFWTVTAGESASLKLIFYYFSSKNGYRTSLGVSWAFSWRLSLSQLVIYIPDIVYELLVQTELSQLNDIILTLIYDGCTLICCGIYVVLFIWLVLPLLPLPITVINYRHHRLRDNLREAKLISKGLKARFVGFFFSMLGWLILSVLVLPTFFTVPYFFACYAVMMRFAVYQKTATSRQNLQTQ